MFAHYLTVALRNIKRYALQNTICILGLAAGFVCFCLTSICVHYENTYDTFHKDWQNIWSFDVSDADKSESLFNESRPFEAYIPSFDDMTGWPEVELAVPYGLVVGYETKRIVVINESFARMFNLELVMGDMKFLNDPSLVAVSESYAKECFGDENPIGRPIDDFGYNRDFFGIGSENHYVGAVIKDWKHSFLEFDMLVCEGAQHYFDFDGISDVLLKVKPGCDLNALADKVSNSVLEYNSHYKREYVPINISEMHKTLGGNGTKEIHMDSVTIISWTSLLLIICSIINYLIFFLNSLVDRRHEMGLRVVHGSTPRELTAMLSVNIFVILAIAYTIGVVEDLFLVGPFCNYVGFDLPESYFIGGSLLFMFITLVFSVLLCTALSHMVSRRLLKESVANRRSANILSQVSVAVQLAFSIFFIFSTVCISHQYRDIFRKDWGVAVRNRAVFMLRENAETGKIIGRDMSGYIDLIKRLPMVEDVIADGNLLMCGINVGLTDGYLSLDPADEGVAVCTDGGIQEPWRPIYGFTVIQGELPQRRLEIGEVVITADVARSLGLEDAIGKTLYLRYSKFPWGLSVRYSKLNVIAVLKELYLAGPLKRPLPMFFMPGISSHNTLYIQYKEGTRNLLKQEIDKMGLPGDLSFSEEMILENSADSTVMLFTLLLIFSAICILISISGVWSVVILSCRKRRKEIAIRKTFGARTWEVFSIFLRQYGLILAAASVPAFCLGFLFINHWRSQFQQQATISWWIYVVVLAGMAALIYLVVVCSVLRTARENPADVIKSE
ncbi:MAG: FtsX-like permease family protein [Bacteroidaceae bacterium]|nr:FtsX-like permease family protein [Bacteroidaceae bacterium]